jgi:hypothetical protein
MAIKTDHPRLITGAEREALIRRAEEIDAAAGIPARPTLTIEQLHESVRAHGVRPEDNGGSRELTRMRYGDDWDAE